MLQVEAVAVALVALVVTVVAKPILYYRHQWVQLQQAIYSHMLVAMVVLVH